MSSARRKRLRFANGGEAPKNAQDVLDVVNRTIRAGADRGEDFLHRFASARSSAPNVIGPASFSKGGRAKQSDRVHGGDEANPALAGRKGLAARRANGQAAMTAAREQAAGRATRGERRWASPPRDDPEKPATRRAAFLKHLGDLLKRQ